MAYTLGKCVMRAPVRIASAQHVDSMSSEAKFFAHLANVAYLDPTVRPGHQDEFDLDPEFNDDRFVVYTRGWLRVKAVIVAFRGTSNLTDVFADIKLASDTNVNRMKQLLGNEVDCITAVSKKYAGARIHVTGHSLGGTIAMFVTAHTGLIFGGHIFNPGAGFKAEELLVGAVAGMLGVGTGAVLAPLGVSVAAGALACETELAHESYGVGQVGVLTGRITTHHVFGDVLSMLFSLGEIFCYTPNRINFHALTNFLDDDIPSVDGIFSYKSQRDTHRMCNRRASTGTIRGRSVHPSSQVRTTPGHRGNAARRNHSHSGTTGHGDGATEALVNQLSAETGSEEHAWRSDLDVGSKAEVLAHAEEGQRRQWVQVEVLLSRVKNLTVKWFSSSDGAEVWRRVARNSTEMRACRCQHESSHGDDASSQLKDVDGGSHVESGPSIEKQSTRAGNPLSNDKKASLAVAEVGPEDVNLDSSMALDPSVPWYCALRVGSVAEVLVKKQWVPAEVVIARGKVLTMKWIDTQDGGAEVLRRVGRDSTDLRPHEI